MSRAPCLAVLSGEGSFGTLIPGLRARGLRVVRIVVLRTVPVPKRRWLTAVRAGPGWDVLVVTSRHGVEYGLRPWAARTAGVARAPVVWAVGPGTARCVRAAGRWRVRRAPALGARSLAAGLAARPRSRVLYFRSDLAGPDLARRLRAAGHIVREPIVYRTQPSRRLSRRDLEHMAGADAVLVGSPSAIDALRRLLGPSAWRRARTSGRWLVLGPRTATAARRWGVRSVRRAPSAAPQRFTRWVVAEVRDAAR